MSKNDEKHSLTKTISGVPTQIQLGPSTAMDLSWLSESERKALLVDYAKGMIDISKKAQELNVDAVVLKKVLDDLSAVTKEVSEGGNAVTIAHTQTTKVGRTEVMMGNTEQAFKGKLTRSQTGEKDWTLFYIIGAVVALIIIAAIMKG